MNGYDVKFDFDSPITQTLKLKQLPPIEQYMQFIGKLAGIQAAGGKAPTVLDIVNFDEAATDYGEIAKVSPKVINDKNAVAQIREAAAKQQEEMKSEAMLNNLPEQAKTLSQTELADGNALDALVGNINMGSA